MDVAHDRFQIPAYQPATVTPLAGSSLTVGGQIISRTGKDMELILDQPLLTGTPGRVQARNWLMLGEVLYCVPDRTRHAVRLRLEHALPSLKNLMDMNRHFFGQAARAPLKQRDGYSGWT